MEKEITKLIILILSSVLTGLLAGIPIHEFGHLLGGLFAGYRFTSMTMFGVGILQENGKMKARRRKGLPIGQCLMHPRCLKQNPAMLIAGGIVANMSVGVFSLIVGILSESIEKTVVYLSFGGMNLAMGLMNIIPDSPTNDGSTLRDATKNELHTEMYNRIMLVYRDLERGSRYMDLDENLLDAPDIYDSTLAAELALYRYYRIRDLYSDDENRQNLIRIELLKLAHYAPGTGVMEAIRDV